ncbi:MAG: nucleotidyltransferase domain-containing protein [Paludibacteraceae bacterium]|jgi:predicted nucleotidyltransferase|nr:nucleotidyltransferase domain-containing protein [Paludibacteraceae bacterium]
MDCGLTLDDLNKLTSLFAKNEHIERVVLYGSRAKGTFKPFSDVDITLFGDAITHQDLSQLLFDVDDLLLPYQFDISIFNTLKNSDLIEHINRVGIEIYNKLK